MPTGGRIIPSDVPVKSVGSGYQFLGLLDKKGFGVLPLAAGVYFLLASAGFYGGPRGKTSARAPSATYAAGSDTGERADSACRTRRAGRSR